MKKYILYTRKSTENDDRQILSLSSQIEECKSIAEQRGLYIYKTFQESMSAKNPDRPLFNEMIKLLKDNKAQGIICWHVNRLSRNAKDGGELQWLMDDSDIEIVTPHQVYDKDNSSFLFKMETGQSEQYSKNLSKDVTRGNIRKFELGGWCGMAPPGYLNDENKLSGAKVVIKDEERFEVIKRMWKLVLDGKSVPEICKIATEQWHYKSRTTRKKLGVPIKDTTLFRIFRNPFYYGYLIRNVGGELRKGWGNHEPMISKQEFDKVQELLGFVHRPPIKHTWGLNNLIHCGSCGRTIVFERHTKKYKNGKSQTFIYGRCSKRNTNCNERYARFDDLIEQISHVLAQVTLSPKVVDVCVEYLKRENEKENNLQIGDRKLLQKQINDIQIKEGKLLELYLSSGMTEDEYKSKKKEMAENKELKQERLEDLEYRSKHWFELAEKTFNFAKNCLDRFENGSADERHEIIRVIGGSNLTLKDGKLNFIPVKPYYFIYKKPLLGASPSNGGPDGV